MASKHTFSSYLAVFVFLSLFIFLPHPYSRVARPFTAISRRLSQASPPFVLTERKIALWTRTTTRCVFLIAYFSLRPLPLQHYPPPLFPLSSLPPPSMRRVPHFFSYLYSFPLSGLPVPPGRYLRARELLPLDVKSLARRPTSAPGGHYHRDGGHLHSCLPPNLLLFPLLHIRFECGGWISPALCHAVLFRFELVDPRSGRNGCVRGKGHGGIMSASCFSIFDGNLINLHIKSLSLLPACYLLTAFPKFMK